MRHFLIVALFLCALAHAEPAAEPAQVTQNFYNKYLKVEDTVPWVLKSDQVTPAFKKTYAAFMKEPGFDPIVAAQDVPASGYQVAGSVTKGETATVTMKSHDPGFPKPIKVHLVLRDGRWLINGVNGLVGN